MIRIITYLINKLTQYREYLIDKSFPRRVNAQEWAKGYEDWMKRHMPKPVPTIRRKYGTKRQQNKR